MRAQLTVLIVFLLSINTVQHLTLSDDDSQKQFTSSRATGVDLSVSDISYGYPNFADQQKYQMFSSNYPIFSFNRPELLFVVDAVIDVEIEVTVEIENLGTTNSAIVDVNFIVLHNEYQGFEIYNGTSQVNSIRAQSSATTSFKFTPTYAGNHSVIATPTTSAVDDNPANDVMMGTFTVASHYFNCDDLNLWTVGQSWGMNSDTSLSEGSACHIGNGQSSNYNSNLATDLITPVMDMSDAIPNPTRTNGISFYYTGSLGNGDFVRIYSMNPSNSWTELASITGTVDNDFSDSANWQTWSVNNAGAFSPLVPSPQQNFHINSQFRFGFTSDANVNDIGLWMDDIVIVYDQKLRSGEFGISSTGLSTTGTVPNGWGKATIELTNTGNVSESFTPLISGIPMDWQYYFSTTSGVSITESNGVYLEKGQTRVIELNYQPKVSENVGFYPVTFSASSKTHQSVISELSLQLEVVPDRIPEFLPISELISCSPGSSCFTSLSLTNVGGAADVFSLSLDYGSLPIGWSVSFSWNQASEVLVQPGFTVPVMLTYSVGSDAVPDSVGSFDLIATSQNDSSRSDRLTVEVIASMVSDASIQLSQPSQNGVQIAPGDSLTVTFTVTNNASVQDIFETNVIIEGSNDWIVNNIYPQQLFLNSGDTGTFSAKISAPATAQVGDNCPQYFGSIISQRSGDIFMSTSIDNLQISQINNVALKFVNVPDSLTPGETNEISLELSNLGNGPVSAAIDLEGLPSNWEYKFKEENIETAEIIQLGEISDINSKKLIVLSIEVPNGVDHSLIFDIKISVIPISNGDDIDMYDNELELTLVTDVVRKLSLSQTQSTINAGIGNSTTINFKINNLGNLDEQNLQFSASLSSDGYNGEIIGFMTIGNIGIPYEFNQFHLITLNKNSSRNIRVDIIIPSDIDINTVIEFDFTLSSADNQFENLQHEGSILVDYVRDISTSLSTYNPDNSQDFGSMWLNISTISTLDEQYVAKFTTPDDWRLICDSTVVGIDGLTLDQRIINSIERKSSIFCEVINEGDMYEGDISVSVYDGDNVLIDTNSKSFVFSRPVKDDSSFATPLVSGAIISALVIGIIISLLVLKNRKDDDIDDNLTNKPISGPPISGPPITNPTVKVEQTPLSTGGTQQIIESSAVIPPVPQEGLPQGWTLEQWQYYGQQYLDMNKRQ